MSFKDPLNTDEPDWSAPTHSEHTVHLCHGCRIVLEGHGIKYFIGWPYCVPCYREVVELSMTPDQRELAGQEQASRADIERDDTYTKVRRI